MIFPVGRERGREGVDTCKEDVFVCLHKKLFCLYCLLQVFVCLFVFKCLFARVDDQ